MTTKSTLGAWPQVWRVPEADAPRYVAQLRRQLMGSFDMPDPPPVRRAYETGLACLRATGVDLTPLPQEAQDAFRLCCQHRLELLQTEGMLPGCVVYDGRAMYLGVASLPVGTGPVRHVGAGHRPSPDDRGRVRVRFTVPPDWKHVGLLGVPPGDGTAWRWPSEPGSTWETWCDVAEVRLSEAYHWRVEVLEGWLLGRAAPLAPWAGRLETLYDRAMRAGDPLLARLYRDICIITIGELHSRGLRDAETPIQRGHEALIAPGEAWSVTPDGYTVHERVSRDKPADTFHPEWAAGVWSYTHYRIARALLSVPVEQIIAVRGDAIYLTEAPTWVDSGRVGALRFQGYAPGPLPAPRSFDPDLTELGRRVRR
jgi:hypothetical protein